MKQDIRELLRKHKGLTAQEIESRLNVDDFSMLVRTLVELEEEDLIFVNENKYYLIDDDNYYIGKVNCNRKYGLHLYCSDILLQISDRRDVFLFPEDDVIYYVSRNKAHIVKVIRHNLVYLVGRITRIGQYYSFEPLKDVYTKFKLQNKTKLPIKDGLIVKCYISDYDKRIVNVCDILGNEDDDNVLVESIIASEDIKRFFPKKVIDEANSFDENIKLEDYPDYKDLTNELIVTIDGDTAKDFDDAISVKKLEDGYRLIVSIADVSNYVMENSNLDKEAFARGTSIYYPNAVIPMLPFELSDNLCSLMPNVLRLTVTCDMKINNNGDVVDYSLYKAIIKSKHRLTYNLVNEYYAKIYSFEDEELEDMLSSAKELSKILENKRNEKGYLAFASTELKFEMEGDRVVSISKREEGISEHVIETFMIAANETVASHMRYLEYPMVYRCHDVPKTDRIESFIDFVAGFGYVFKGNKHALKLKQLSECLNSFKDSDEFDVVSDTLLRSMAKAKYETVNHGHYGLGLDDYCHFTSPIRRYPDLIVHRMLKKYVFDKNFMDIDEDNKTNSRIVIKANECEKKAVNVERSIDDLRACQYMEEYLGYVFEGTINSVVSFGFFVTLDNGVEGLVHIKTLDGYYTLIDNELVSDIDSYKLGQRVKVKCMNVDKLQRNIDFIVMKGQRRNR